MEHLLSQAAADLTIRSAVEATLRSVLHDVEHAYTLTQALRNHNALQHYHEQLGALKLRYEEREALWEEERREKERLGLLLTEEIVKLSFHELKEEKLKKEMEMKIKQLEIEREDLLKQQQTQSIAVRVESDVIAPPAVEDATLKNEAEAPTPTHANNVVAGPETKSPTILGAQAHANAIPLEVSKEQVEVLKTETIASSSTTTIAELLVNMEEPALMAIFAFLSPLEIMNLAQINRAMYSKVNTMFGQTSEVSAEEVNATTNVETTTTAPSVSAGTAASNTTTTATPTSSGSSNDRNEFSTEVINNLKALGFQEGKVISCLRASNGNPDVAAEYLMNGIPPGIAASAGKAAAQTPKSSPTLVGMAGPPGHKRQNSGTSVATAGTTGTTGSAGNNPFSQMSSWFGAAETSTSASTAPSSAASVVSTSTDTGEIKLNAAMASSMASKLTPAELSIILRMRERLQKCEADAIKYRQEKEDVAANLKSVEAVKEFLVTKVRDTEKVVKEKDEEMKRVKSKALTDQEVITFLDEKVKRLEKEVNDFKSNEHATRKEAHDMVSKNEKKVVVLTDMLRFERQQISANEKEWKAAKKVLIKEVKNCRARIVALEAEYEGCLQQNSQLKQGLLSFSQPGSPGKKSLKFR
mmetsp:Transcript_24103/g.36819  ORF Transcript_24103/g.36819 Transcript_24103/m.36819 type:complete len:641 (-) Transcript_24103:47-1969(-)